VAGTRVARGLNFFLNPFSVMASSSQQPTQEASALYTTLVTAYQNKLRAKEQNRSEMHEQDKMSWMTSQQDVEDSKANPTSQISRLTRADIVALVSAKASSNDLVLFLRAILDCSSETMGGGLDRNVWVFEAVLGQLAEGGHEASKQLARREDIVGGLLLPRVNTLPDRIIAFLAEQAYECALGLKVNPNTSTTRAAVEAVFELLAKLVFRLKSAGKGFVDPDSRCRHDLSSLDGDAFRNYVVNNICHARWDDKSVVPILASLRDLAVMKLSVENRDLVCAKLVQHIPKVPSKDLPDLVHESLLLSLRLDARKPICEAIIAFFESQQPQLDVLGHCLGRFNMLVSQDANLGAVMHKIVDDSAASTPTKLAFLLSMGRVKRFEKKVLDLIVARAKAQAKLNMQVRNSAFLLFALKDHLRDDGELANLVLQVAQDAHDGGWDLLVPILLELGTRLCDVEAPSEQHDNTHPMLDLEADAEEDEANVTSSSSSLTSAVASLGVKLVAKCFELFALHRAEILAQITARALVTRGTPVQFVRVLSRIASTRAIQDLSASVKELCSLLPSMSVRVGHAVLRALRVLLVGPSAQRDLRDHLMIVLRKAMFQRDADSRAVALFGLLTVWQAGSQHGGWEDVVGPLCRALGHQVEIRHALCAGLRAGLRDEGDEKVVDAVLNAWREKFFVASGNNNDETPFNFTECVDPALGRIVVPLVGLIELSELDMIRARKLSRANLGTCKGASTWPWRCWPSPLARR
jgi:hypothetical protein